MRATPREGRVGVRIFDDSHPPSESLHMFRGLDRGKEPITYMKYHFRSTSPSTLFPLFLTVDYFIDKGSFKKVRYWRGASSLFPC